MSPVRGRSSILLLASLLFALPAAALADNAREWLSRMEKAVETLSYEGTFVHMVGNSIETMHVIHRSVDGDIAERLYSRDQPGREILRHNDKVTCIFADQRTVLVERRKGRHGAPLLGALPQDSSEVESWYEFRETGQGRKIGRTARIIEIRPRDEYRYGHRLWLDTVTAMPLKIQLLDHEGVAVEQIQFVSMMVPAEISDARLQPGVEVEGFSWYEHDRPSTAAVVADPPAVGWAIEEPPPGFRLTESRVRTLPGAQHPVEHMVYTDGLASVSVFVEPAEATDQELSGLSRMGAAHAFTLILEGQQITAVGEVPPVTVERIARSLRATEAPTP
jgi:sigma-E factor negative regulatory protein RseB